MNTKHTTSLPTTSSIAYWQYGIKGGPVILMIHGFRGTHHGLEKIVEALPEYSVIVPDLPGFGESKPFTHHPHSLDAYTNFVDEFITSLTLKEPPILLGHSFGSIIAGHFAARYPKKISNLILINPISAPALKGPRGIMTRLAIGYYWLGKKLPKSMSHKWLSAAPIIKVMSITMAKTKDKRMLDFIHDQHLRYFSKFANVDMLAEAFHTSVSNNVSDIADELHVPTLLIAGELDDITTVDKQETLHNRISSSKLEVIQEVGHLIHYEKPTEAAKIIRAFLQQ